MTRIRRKVSRIVATLSVWSQHSAARGYGPGAKRTGVPLVHRVPLGALSMRVSHLTALMGSSSGHDIAESGRDDVLVSPMETLVTLSFTLLLYARFWFWSVLLPLFISVFHCRFSFLRALVVHIFLGMPFADVFFLFSTGIDFKIKTVELQGKKIKLQIWWVNN